MKTLIEVLEDARQRRVAVGHFNFSELAAFKVEQTSRLSGQPADDGAAYDAKEPPAPKLVLQVPQRAKEGIASLDQVASILKDIDVPPLKLTRDDMLIRAESMPPFPAKVLDLYKPDGEMTPPMMARPIGAFSITRDGLHIYCGKYLQ